MTRLESAARQALMSVESNWPPEPNEKRVLAEFFALQAVRGIRWKSGYQSFAQRFARGALPTRQSAAAAESFFLTNSQWTTHMLATVPKYEQALLCMHWSMIEFSSALVATSDHPVVVWPWPGKSQAPEQAAANSFGGPLQAFEVRLPVSPTRVLLLCWADVPDEMFSRVKGHRYHAQAINAFTIAQAVREWFHLPGAVPPRGSGRFVPLSPEFIRGYSTAAMDRSHRLQMAERLIEPMKGELHVPEVTFIEVKKKPSTGL